MVRTRMASRNPISRAAAFKAALAYAGMTKTQWCAERKPNPVTDRHLNEVLAGRRESVPLMADVERFIAEYTPRGVAA